MIFVTGATGFLGSYLVKDLIRKGEKIRALKRKTSGFKLLGDYVHQIEWVEGDLLDVSTLVVALDGVEKIFHCAGAVATAATSGKDIAVNVEGTANLFNIALDKKVK